MKVFSPKLISMAWAGTLCLGLVAWEWHAVAAAPFKNLAVAEQTPSQSGAQTQSGQAPTANYTKEEYDGLQKIGPMTDPKAKAEAVEEFLKKYPNSSLAGYAHREALSAYQQLNKAEKIIEHGELVLKQSPTDVQVLSLMAYVYSERPSMDKSFREKALQSAQKAIDQLGSMVKPAAVTDADWERAKKQLLTMNYSTEGLVFLNYGMDTKDKEEKNKHLTKSVDWLQKALELNKADDLSWYRLGLAYIEQNKGEDAVKSLAKAVAINGPVKSFAQTTLEDIYKKLHKNSTEGLADVIKKATEELGAK
ncbi:MAG: hypothetical protein HYR55_10725 [Acidobacteria bacterium]|nr:hypothetical protein [Acidobacteriota bacterium]MBI3658047.1 hypothetical protein [Acidobacteriota bacterium]